MRYSLQLRDKDSITVQRRRALLAQKRRRRKALRVLWRESGYATKIKAPFALNIASKGNRKYSMKFIEDVRSAIIDRRRPVILDFSETEFLVAAAVLLLTAELDRAKRIVGNEFRVKIEPSKYERVNAVLTQIGIAAMCECDLDTVEDQSNDESVRHWRYATGERVNEQTTKAFEVFEGRLTANVREGMWKSISEAIVNSTEHAYLEPRGTNHHRLGHKRWWMFSQERDGELSVVVCDLGIGIPRSLPLKWDRSTLARIYDGLVGQGPDVRAIRAAMRVGESSTGKRHRGRGLPQIWHELQDNPNAKIMIMSNKAMLYWDGATKRDFSREFASSINGTLVAWKLRLPEKRP